MKMPRYVVTIAGRDFIVASKNGIGALTEFMADALPVAADLRAEPPEIELSWSDEPTLIEYLQSVVCRPIPANVVWKQKTKRGEVVEVRPVEKTASLRAPKAKALPPAPKVKALPAPDPQRPLELGI